MTCTSNKHEEEADHFGHGVIPPRLSRPCHIGDTFALQKVFPQVPLSIQGTVGTLLSATFQELPHSSPPTLLDCQDMRRNLLPVMALLLGTLFLFLGNGLHGLLLPVRGSAEGYSNEILGLLGTS